MKSTGAPGKLTFWENKEAAGIGGAPDISSGPYVKLDITASESEVSMRQRAEASQRELLCRRPSGRCLENSRLFWSDLSRSEEIQKSQPNEDERSDISGEILRRGVLDPNMTPYLQNIFRNEVSCTLSFLLILEADSSQPTEEAALRHWAEERTTEGSFSPHTDMGVACQF